MFIVRMFDKTEERVGFLTPFHEFGLRDEAQIFFYKNDADVAIRMFKIKVGKYANEYIYKVKKIA